MAGSTVIGGPTECDIRRVRGDTLKFRVLLKDSTGSAIDVTGYTGTWTIDTLKDPPDAMTNVASISGSPTGTPTDGIIEFSPTAMEMDLDPSTTYYYDVQITDAGADLNTVLKGKLKIVQDISK